MEDEQILQLFWERSENALVQVQQKYGKLLCRIASNILPDKRDVEEAASDTYLRLWNSIPPQKPAHFMAYCARICRNISIDILRENHRGKRDSRAEVLFSELEGCMPARESLSERLEEQELVERINRYLGTLDRTSRVLFVRRYFAMDDLESLARDYGMTKHAVSARLYRIRSGLKHYLKKEGIAV